jgi:hypothetical protein
VPSLTHSVLSDGLKWANDGGGKAIISGTPRATAKRGIKVWVRAANAIGARRQLLIISVPSSTGQK